MAESFDYVKQLIDEERYMNHKKDDWGGCNVIIISEEKYKIRKESIDYLKSNRKWINIVKTNYASSIIWLIETLKPYVNYDYLNKYEYYGELADYINSVKDTVKDEKELLISIIYFLEKHEPSWEKELHRDDLEKSFMNWYQFGIEHNDPFFVKFVALWMGFNEKYISFPGKLKFIDNETRATKIIYDVETEKINEFCDENACIIESIHEKVFNSPFINVFTKEPVKDMKKGYLTGKNKKNYNNLINKNGIVQTKALLQTIYQVRCNLFHGSKSPDEQRDIALVRCSGEIMEMYMNAII